MKRRMTTKKALRITAEQHRWLAKNPKALPSDWPGWEDLDFDMSVTSKDKDPLCQVAEGNCMKCPLIALWIQDSAGLPKNQQLKSCLVRTSPFMVRQRFRHSIRSYEREEALEAATAIFIEAEYALENGVREPDMSIYVKRARRVRGGEEEPRRSRRKRGTETTRTRRVR